MINEKPEVIVVWRKNERATKRYMTVFKDIKVDDVLEEKRKPLLDNSYTMDEVGIGSSFIDTWQHKYKINKYNIVKK
jgi:hypothetical protein